MKVYVLFNGGGTAPSDSYSFLLGVFSSLEKAQAVVTIPNEGWAEPSVEDERNYYQCVVKRSSYANHYPTEEYTIRVEELDVPVAEEDLS